MSSGLPPASQDSVWLPGRHAYMCSRLSIPESLAFMTTPCHSLQRLPKWEDLLHLTWDKMTYSCFSIWSTAWEVSQLSPSAMGAGTEIEPSGSQFLLLYSGNLDGPTEWCSFEN